jgi:hypothetical protein
MLAGKDRAQVKHVSGSPLWDRLLAIPANIKLGWNGFPRTNTGLLQNCVYYRHKKLYKIVCR